MVNASLSKKKPKVLACVEANGSKGGWNARYCLIRYLDHFMHILTGYELNIAIDDCPGQNRNNIVLRMLLILTFSKRLKFVNVLFLIKSHVKNATDKTFNLMNKSFHRSDMSTHDVAGDMLNDYNEVHFITTDEFELRHWNATENRMLRKFPKDCILTHYMFSPCIQILDTLNHAAVQCTP